MRWLLPLCSEPLGTQAADLNSNQWANFSVTLCMVTPSQQWQNGDLNQLLQRVSSWIGQTKLSVKQATTKMKLATNCWVPAHLRNIHAKQHETLSNDQKVVPTFLVDKQQETMKCVSSMIVFHLFPELWPQKQFQQFPANQSLFVVQHDCWLSGCLASDMLLQNLQKWRSWKGILTTEMWQKQPQRSIASANGSCSFCNHQTCNSANTMFEQHLCGIFPHFENQPIWGMWTVICFRCSAFDLSVQWFDFLSSRLVQNCWLEAKVALLEREHISEDWTTFNLQHAIDVFLPESCCFSITQQCPQSNHKVAWTDFETFQHKHFKRDFWNKGVFLRENCWRRIARIEWECQNEQSQQLIANSSVSLLLKTADHKGPFDRFLVEIHCCWLCSFWNGPKNQTCTPQELLGTTIKRSTTVMRSSSDVQAPTDQLILVFLLLDLPPHPQEGLLHCVVALVFCPLLLTATMLFSSTLSFLNSHKTSFDCLTVSSTCMKWVVFFDQLTLWHWLDTSFTVFLQDRQLCESWPFFLVKLPAHLFACHMWSWHVHIDGFFRNVSLIGEQHLIFDCSNLWIFSSTGSVFPSLAWWVVNNSVLFLLLLFILAFVALQLVLLLTVLLALCSFLVHLPLFSFDFTFCTKC